MTMKACTCSGEGGRESTRGENGEFEDPSRDKSAGTHRSRGGGVPAM